jgi:hypothetical protein
MRALGVLLVVVGFVGCVDDGSDCLRRLPTPRQFVAVELVRLPGETSTRGLSPCPSDPGPGARQGGYWRDATAGLGCKCADVYVDAPSDVETHLVSCVGYPMCLSGALVDGGPKISHYVECRYEEAVPVCPL